MRIWSFAFILAATAMAEAAPSLLVLDFQSKGILDKTVLEQLWERSQENAAMHAGYALVPSQDARKRLFDQSILVPTHCGEECYARLAEKLNVDLLLVPSVEKNAGQLKVGFVLVKSNGKKVAEGTAFSDGRVGKAMDDALQQVFGSSDAGSISVVSASRWVVAGAVTAVGVGAILFLSFSHPSPGNVNSSSPTDHWTTAPTVEF